MRLALRSTKVLALSTAVLCGCHKDDPGGSGDESSSTGSSSSSSTTTGMTLTTSTTAPADTSSSAAETSSSEESSTGPVEVTISGVVQDFAAAMPINAAEISVIDMAGFDTVSDADGNYSIGPFPPATEIFVEIDPDVNYLGSVIGLTTPDSDDDGQQLAQISRATVDLQLTYLMDQMPAEADLTQSIVVVRLLQQLAVNEGPTTVTFDPPPPADTFYAPDETAAPVLGQNTIEYNLLPVVVYFNVAPDAGGTYTITAEHPTRTCTVVHPAFPTLGEHVTLVDLDCV